MRFQPSDAAEVRDVKMAGKYLAKLLRDALEDFGGMPARLAPAVLVEALNEAVPLLLTMANAAEWPGSLTANREQMRRGLLELLQTTD